VSIELSPGQDGALGRRQESDGERVRRVAPLVGLTARTVAEGVAVGVRSKLTGADSTDFHVRTAERYTELLGHSKGALMKAGQMLSLSFANPLVPAELQSIYQTSLARLRSDAPPMAPELAREALELELGRHTASAFAEFNWTPLAAASIGQVHAARLHDGRRVAVKIQYPGVAKAIAADLKNNELLATFLSLLIHGASLRKVRWDIRGYAREIHTHVSEELDYRLEAANQADFAQRYRGHPFIHVPEVVAELCTDRVLTQELVDGIGWDDALAAPQALRDRWAEAIYRFSFGSFVRFHAINADPHPGNYLFHADGSVSFLDFGCAKRFKDEQVAMLDAILRAVLQGDALGTWRACVEAGFWRSSDPVTPAEALAWWRKDCPTLDKQSPRGATPKSITQWITRRYSPNGPSANALMHATPPADCSIMERMAMGVYVVIAQLRANIEWHPIAAERFAHAPPCTAMGKLERTFFAERRVSLTAGEACRPRAAGLHGEVPELDLPC
jgi:predicted unusual protein kinase regulating ubiquinone biosynthesis (AarF/ABC1/UbiB family)